MAKAQSGIPWGAALAVLVKGTKLLKFLKAFKVAKPLLTFGTMSLSMLAYAFWLGPWFALAFVLLLFLHEMGHVVAMRVKGFGTPSPVFIPFLGAAIFAPEFTNRDDEAYVGYGGPLLGSIAALAVFGMYFLAPKGSDLATILLASSYVGVYLNLFNLIPVSPLDGGRVTQAVGRWFKYIGLVALAAFSVLLREPVILLIWILVLGDFSIIPIRIRAVIMVLLGLAMGTLMTLGYSSQPVWVDVFDCVLAAIYIVGTVVMAFRPDLEEDKDDRPDLTPRQRWTRMILYLGLAIALVGIIFVQAQYLPHHTG